MFSRTRKKLKQLGANLRKNEVIVQVAVVSMRQLEEVIDHSNDRRVPGANMGIKLSLTMMIRGQVLRRKFLERNKSDQTRLLQLDSTRMKGSKMSWCLTNYEWKTNM